LLLDTCAAIWLMERAAFSKEGMAAMVAAYERGENLSVSPITAWEMGFLVSRGRMPSVTSPGTWFKSLLASEAMELAKMTPEILIGSSSLPGDLHRDPADRILIATARELGMTIVTRDRMILDYAARGHVSALAC
jgi:PIN domain nuclease of toxin-antitoxin system